MYALLREAMVAAGVIGIARVVMHTKEHLAALVPSGAALVLNTLRWSNEIRDTSELNLPAEGKKAANIKDSELKMAEQLIADMTAKWDATNYSDKFTVSIEALVAQRVMAGQTETVKPLEEEAAPTSSNVIDLTELLKKSLGSRRSGSTASAANDSAPQRKSTAKVARTAEKSPARKRA